MSVQTDTHSLICGQLIKWSQMCVKFEVTFLHSRSLIIGPILVTSNQSTCPFLNWMNICTLYSIIPLSVVDTCQCMSEGVAGLCVIILPCVLWSSYEQRCTLDWKIQDVPSVVSLPQQLSGDIPGHVGFLCDKVAVLRKAIKRQTLYSDNDRNKVKCDAEISNSKLFIPCYISM